MGNVSFTIEEENLICIYQKHDRRRTIAAISEMCIRDRVRTADGKNAAHYENTVLITDGEPELLTDPEKSLV